MGERLVLCGIVRRQFEGRGQYHSHYGGSSSEAGGELSAVNSGFRSHLESGLVARDIGLLRWMKSLAWVDQSKGITHDCWSHSGFWVVDIGNTIGQFGM